MGAGAGVVERCTFVHAGARIDRGAPLWLWRQPLPLREQASRPWLDGTPLQLLAGPERIESGWWDGDLAARDYFIARAHDGALVWVFRARLPLSGTEGTGWFLQGRFA